jgi:hypothetical protein
VELLNKTTVAKFPQLKSFQESFNYKKKIEKLYSKPKSNTVTIENTTIEDKYDQRD